MVTPLPGVIRIFAFESVTSTLKFNFLRMHKQRGLDSRSMCGIARRAHVHDHTCAYMHNESQGWKTAYNAPPTQSEPLEETHG